MTEKLWMQQWRQKHEESKQEQLVEDKEAKDTELVQESADGDCTSKLKVTV